MTNVDQALSALHLAGEKAEALQVGLSRRQEDLLAIEETARHNVFGDSSGLPIVDRAEDLRRKLNAHKADQMTAIHAALVMAEGAICLHTASDPTSSASHLPGVRLLDVTTEEIRQALIEIYWIDRALAPLSQCNPSDRELGSIAQKSIDEAACRLEHARRSAFRIVEDLPFVEVIVQDLLAERHPAIQPDLNPGRRSALPGQMLRPIPSAEGPDVGFGPDR